MDLLVVGDVHGCYYTLQKLVQQHWRAGEERLIQIGDLINKGANSGLCIKYWRELEASYGKDLVCLIRGNHEQLLLGGGHSLGEIMSIPKLEKNIREAGLDLEDVRHWVENTAVKWENEHIFMSHAGIGEWASDPYRLNGPYSIIYNKGPLKELDRLQVKGHTIVEGHKPLFSTREYAWYIDTGAWTKGHLSGIRLNDKGELLEVVRVELDARDKADTETWS